MKNRTIVLWCLIGVFLGVAFAATPNHAAGIGRLDIIYSIKTDGVRIMIVKDNNTNREFLVTDAGGVAEIKPKE